MTVLATGSVHYAGSDGTIVVPYRTQIVNPPDQTIAITVGNFACLSRFPHYVCKQTYIKKKKEKRKEMK